MDDSSIDETEMRENIYQLKYLQYFQSRCRMVSLRRVITVKRRNDMELLDEYDFISRYRVEKDTVRNLLDRFGDKLQSQSSKTGVMSPLEQILIALRFYATGTFQIVVGDLTNLSQSSCCRAINKVSHHISKLCTEYIQLPKTESERKLISQEFYNISGFPGVYGAIDCTHIRIQSPGGENAEIFRNRKGYFSLNVQTVSDANLLIRNIVARWPGSTHDSTIFGNSHLCVLLQCGLVPAYYHLLGDGGYGCKPYLMTPILNPEDVYEKRYNESHVTARNTVERQYGVWKRRFPCLSVGLRSNLTNAMNIIVATAVLHNMEVQKGNILDDDDLNYVNDVPVEAVTNRNPQGFAKRKALIRDFFM